MPYISLKDDRREKLRLGEPALTAGELNYQIFYYVKHNYINFLGRLKIGNEIIDKFVEQFLGEKPNYQRYNDMTGALIRCYAEIKRRLNIEFDYLIDLCASYDNEIAKYEDIKIKENGDVE
jgi:hypothetical protein